MKRILSLIIIAVLCLGIFTSCAQLEGLLGGIIPGFGGETPDNGGEDVEYNLPRAAEYISTMYKGTPDEEIGKTITQNDFNVAGQCRIASVPYTVNWSTDNELVKATKNEDGSWTIDVTSDSEVAYDYKLIATIIAGDGTSTTVEFNFHVQAYVLSSFEEYMAAESGATVTIEGIVVAMNAKSLGNSRNHLFLADANVTGGYYIYQMDADPVESGIKIGMTVSVTGPVSPYSGMQEIKGGVATIIDETIKDPFVPVDITEAFKNGDSLANYVGLPVTVKGVTIGAQDLSTSSSQYLYFELNGVKAYVRTYVTDFPTSLQIVVNEDTTVTSPDKDAIDAAHAAKFGWTANATGILVLYNSNPYLIPMDTNCFEYLKFVEKTADEKIAAELDTLTFDSTFTSDAVVDLLLAGKNYSDVAISWASDNDAIAIADGKATIVVPEKGVTVKLTATLTCGDKTATKEFEVKVSQSLTSIPAIIEIAKGLEDKGPTTEAKYLVAGVITEIKSEKYGNMYITDSQGNKLYIYGLYDANDARYDAMEVKPVVGDYIVVLSVVGHYNEPQLKNAHITTHIAATSIPDANTAGNALENKGPSTEEKYLVSGEITEIKSDKYGNMYIKDAEGNSIYVYGLYSDDGAVRYDAMEVKPAVGDTVTVLGVLSNYNGVQVKNAWLVAHTVKATTEPETPVEPETPAEGYKVELPATGTNLTSENVFAGITESGYAACNGDHTVGELTVSTNNVMAGTQGIYNVIQFKKQGSTFTVDNVNLTTLTVLVISTFDYTGHVDITVGGTAITLPDAASVNATAVSTGVKNDNGYEFKVYTLTVTLDSALAGELVITNNLSYAVYMNYINIQ